MTTMADFPIDAKVKPLADILCECKKLVIPHHQRPYDWSRKNVKTFIHDLTNAIKSNHSHYFLGTIMLVPSTDKDGVEVSDGQQRITTFMLLFANLCKSFHEYGNTDGEKKTLRLLFALDQWHTKTFKDAKDMHLSPRVVPLTLDKTNFEMLITGNEVRKNGNLVSASLAIAEALHQQGFTTKSMRLKLLNFLLKNLLVVRIDFKNAVDSISVFETQNTRGKNLAQIQLVCTYFFYCFSGDAEGSNRLNEQISQMRLALRGEDRFFDYARCLFQCQYGHLTKTDFYSDMKSALLERVAASKGNSPKKEVQKMAGILSQRHRIEIFQMLSRRSAQEELFKKLTTDAGKQKSRRSILDYMEDLEKYTSVSNPILFALFCRYAECLPGKERETAKFAFTSCKLLASFFQRAAHSFEGSFRPSEFEVGVAELAKNITAGKCSTVDNFFKALQEMDKKGMIINDSRYKKRMEEISFAGKDPAVRHVLAKINEHLDPEISVVKSLRTLEHILPKGKEHIGDWSFDESEHALYVNRMGNLTLLSTSDNKSNSDGNASYRKKLGVFRASSYKITKELCIFPKWNKDSIMERQKYYARIAVAVWNFRIK